MTAITFTIDVGYDEDADTIEWVRASENGTPIEQQEYAEDTVKILREAVEKYLKEYTSRKYDRQRST